MKPLQRHLLRGLACLVATLTAIAVCGCGSQGLYSAGGKVVYKDGKPVTGGRVIFEPITNKVSALGYIQEDGSFRLSTNRENDGAPEGDYKVLVLPPPTPEEGKKTRLLIAAKYQSLDMTPFKFTVTKDSAKNKFTLEVE